MASYPAAVSYAITFVRSEPGMTASQTLEWLNASYDADARPVTRSFDPGELAVWGRIVEVVTRTVGPASSAVFQRHVELAWDSPRIRLEYSGDTAHLTVPYWYRGETGRDVMRTVFAVGRIVESEAGFEGIDEQTGMGLTEEGLACACRQYDETSARASELSSDGI